MSTRLAARPRGTSPRRKVLKHRPGRWRVAVRSLWRLLKAAPPQVRFLALLLAAFAGFAIADAAYQIARKPSEMLFPISGAFNKTPAEIWARYGALFRDDSTANVSPELLAALAQVETSGNPIARTYWRWRLTANPFAIYQPASSSVGLYQMTDGTFDEARHYCIRHHAVVESDGWRSCWFNGLYTRLLPSDAVELTAVSLDRGITAVLAREHVAAASAQQKRDLAAVLHLCGAGPASAFAGNGFRLAAGARCGDQDAASYLAQVRAMVKLFSGFAASA